MVPIRTIQGIRTTVPPPAPPPPPPRKIASRLRLGFGARLGLVLGHAINEMQVISEISLIACHKCFLLHFFSKRGDTEMKIE